MSYDNGTSTRVIVGMFITIISVILIAIYSISGAKSFNKYENEVGSYWSLADKSSTIPAKAAYIDKFVDALTSQHLEGKHNAIWLENPDNNFDMNFTALKTLQLRLHEIEKMDVTSFEYNTAINQITAQEQGEAGAMIGVFHGVWFKEHAFMWWDWVAGLTIFSLIVMLILGIVNWCWEVM